MSILVATHSGPFHADDVLAWALVRKFVERDAALVRTRDKTVLATADIVFDVGGIFDPATRRFDHHQSSYEGPLSSAGMVLRWLSDEQRLPQGLVDKLQHELVAYVDDVDNGRVAPKEVIPCFPRIVEAMNQPAKSEEDFDRAFRQAGEMAYAYVNGIEASYYQTVEAERVVLAAMKEAKTSGSNLICFDDYYRWKPIYFEHGGAEHPTEFVLFPGTDGTWRIVAIPPVAGSFEQKQPLPLDWAGLSDQDLEAVTGVSGSIFCHKNRFIAVFATREGALEAMGRHGLLHTDTER